MQGDVLRPAPKIAGWSAGSRAVKAGLPPCAGEKRKLHRCSEPALPAIAVCDTAGSVSRCRDPVLQRDGAQLSPAMT